MSRDFEEEKTTQMKVVKKHESLRTIHEEDHE